MAKQFSVTINGSEVVLSSVGVQMVSTGASATTIFLRNNGGALYSTSPIATLVSLANTGGVEQVQVTTIRVNDSNQVSTIQMAFPVSAISVNSSNISGSNSVIIYQGARFYVSETPAAILAAANAGDGGGSQTLQEVLTEGSILTDVNTIDTDGNNFTILLDVNNKIALSSSGVALTGNVNLNGGLFMNSTGISGVTSLSIVESGTISMIDTVTHALYFLTLANGSLVITPD